MAEAKRGKAQKIPATPGLAVDLLDKMRDARKALGAKVEEMKRQEDALEAAIFDKFKKADLEGCRGKRAQASISRSEVPTLDNDEAFFKHLKKHPEDLDLLQRRLSVEAARARWADGVAVPGVGKYTRISLHLSKVKTKSAAKARAPR
jgi:hypothetical protein